MNSVLQNEEWCRGLAAATIQSADIIGRSSKSHKMPRWAVDKLWSAYTYLFAAMMAEFVVKAEREIIGIDGVSMGDGSVKSTREFLIDDVIGKMLGEIRASQGPSSSEFVSAIRSKTSAILMTRATEGVSNA